MWLRAQENTELWANKFKMADYQHISLAEIKIFAYKSLLTVRTCTTVSKKAALHSSVTGNNRHTHVYLKHPVIKVCNVFQVLGRDLTDRSNTIKKVHHLRNNLGFPLYLSQ